MYHINNTTVALNEAHSCILQLIHIPTMQAKEAVVITDHGYVTEIQDAIILNLGLGWAFGLPTTGTINECDTL